MVIVKSRGHQKNVGENERKQHCNVQVWSSFYSQLLLGVHDALRIEIEPFDLLNTFPISICKYHTWTLRWHIRHYSIHRLCELCEFVFSLSSLSCVPAIADWAWRIKNRCSTKACSMWWNILWALVTLQTHVASTTFLPALCPMWLNTEAYVDGLYLLAIATLITFWNDEL